MVNITHRVGIKAPVSKVYEALATVEGVAAWWTTETTGNSVPGGKLDLRFTTPEGTEKGRMSFDVVELERDRKVHWRVADGPDGWEGTDVVFALRQEGDCTIVLFSHENWKEWMEFTSHCSMKWATFMLSLKDLVERGTGRPSPYDLKIDNWN